MRRVFIPMLLAALMIAACGGGPPPATPVPPTATPAPTATPLPPTATPVPVADPEEAITAGLAKSRDVQTYRIELTMSASGNLGELSGGQTTTEPLTVIDVSGEIDGENSRIMLKGLFSAFLGGEPDQGVEFITADGKSYIYGPVAMLNAPEAKWYELPAEQGSPAESFSSAELLDSFGADTADLSALEFDGVEQLDGVQCSIFRGDKEATTQMMGSLGSTGLPGADQIDEIERADLRFWVCEDGYFHKMTLDFAGTTEGQDEPVELQLLLRLYDFEGDISVTAPANAEPIVMPQP